MSKESKKKINTYERVKIDFNPKIPNIPRFKDKTKIDVRYTLVSPFAYAHVFWDNKVSEVLYEVEEPVLTEDEKKYFTEINNAMKDMVDYEEMIHQKQNSFLEYIDRMFKLLAIEFGFDISYESYQKIYYYLVRDFVGFNQVDPLLRDYFVEDIECNGVNTPIYIVHRIFRNLKTNVMFKDMENLANFVEKLAQRAGKYVSYAKPILDGSLPDGSRVNATYTKDISSRGPTFTIRKFTKTPWTPPQLIGFGTLSPEMMAYLWILIQYRMNILIAGGTASGKTTLLNALAFFIPPEARVVTIEDTREVNLPRENWLPSVVRTATGVNESGEIDLFTLLKSSFRQNPDYVIVGEVRGKEAYVLFQGMASGHSSISTIHAESVDSVIKRLETPPIELSPTLLNVLDAVCIMTHAIVNGNETRKLREVVEIIDVTPKGIAKTNTPFRWDPAENRFYFKRESQIFDKISKRYGIPLEKLFTEFIRRSELIRKMYYQGKKGFREVQEIINRYYKKPEEVLKEFGMA